MASRDARYGPNGTTKEGHVLSPSSQPDPTALDASPCIWCPVVGSACAVAPSPLGHFQCLKHILVLDSMLLGQMVARDFRS